MTDPTTQPKPPELPEIQCQASITGKPWSHDTRPQAVWVYRLTSPHWQQAVLTSDGMFSVVGDYGNYAYNWMSWGSRDFREFFIELDASYTVMKIAGRRDEYDQDSTIRHVRSRILDAYRQSDLSKEELREVMEAYHCADFSDPRGVEAFLEETYEDTKGNDVRIWDTLFDGEYPCSYGPPRDACAYSQKMLPALQRVIRDQLEEEKKNAHK